MNNRWIWVGGKRKLSPSFVRMIDFQSALLRAPTEAEAITAPLRPGFDNGVPSAKDVDIMSAPLWEKERE